MYFHSNTAPICLKFRETQKHFQIIIFNILSYLIHQWNEIKKRFKYTIIFEWYLSAWIFKIQNQSKSQSSSKYTMKQHIISCGKYTYYYDCGHSKLKFFRFCYFENLQNLIIRLWVGSVQVHICNFQINK